MSVNAYIVYGKRFFTGRSNATHYNSIHGKKIPHSDFKLLPLINFDINIVIRLAFALKLKAISGNCNKRSSFARVRERDEDLRNTLLFCHNDFE